MKRNSKAYAVTLSAIACSVATIALTVGSYFRIALAAGYVLAAFAIMVPLSEDMYKGATLAYIGACILAFFSGGGILWNLLPFALFFGLHPIINRLQVRFHWNKWLLLIVKIVWFDVVLYLIWRFTLGGTSYEIIDTYILPVIAIGGSLLCYAYDYAMFSCQKVIYNLVRKIGK